jgi:predicted secreted Zn-dependent protease
LRPRPRLRLDAALRACFAFLAVAVAYPGAARVTEDIRYVTYDVKWRNDVPMHTLLARASPIRQHGGIFLGSTLPRVSWKLRFWKLPNGHCRITNVTPALTATITLPGPSDTHMSDDGEFRVFLTRLKTHELGHYDIARKAALDIYRRILKLPEANSCEALEAAAERLGETIWAEMSADQRAYDTGTGLGSSQGAMIEE